MVATAAATSPPRSPIVMAVTNPVWAYSRPPTPTWAATVTRFGLEPGVNHKAMSRAIVMHGARYVDPILGERQGRLGRSFGCPALRPLIARKIIDTLKGGQLLFAYYPDQEWLAQSRFLACRGNAIALR